MRFGKNYDLNSASPMPRWTYAAFKLKMKLPNKETHPLLRRFAYSYKSRLLHHTVIEASLSASEWLLRKGANPWCVNRRGETPMNVADNLGLMGIVKLFERTWASSHSFECLPRPEKWRSVLRKDDCARPPYLPTHVHSGTRRDVGFALYICICRSSVKIPSPIYPGASGGYTQAYRLLWRRRKEFTLASRIDPLCSFAHPACTGGGGPKLNPFISKRFFLFPFLLLVLFRVVVFFEFRIYLHFIIFFDTYVFDDNM